MSDSDSGSDSSSSSGSSSTSSSSRSSASSKSSKSSRSSASSKNSAAEFQRPKPGQESSSSSESSSSESESSKSSVSKKSDKVEVKEVAVVRAPQQSDSESDSSQSSKSSKSTKASSKSSKSSSDSESSSSASESELKKPKAVAEEEINGEESSSSSSSITSSSDGSSSSSSSSSGSESSSSESDTSSSDSEASERSSKDKDTLKKPKSQTANPNDVNLTIDDKPRAQVQVADKEEDPEVAKNFWVRFGKATDKIFFNYKFVPVTGFFTIILCVIFSIVIDVRLSGSKHIPYGASFVTLLIGFLMWSVLLFIMALSRVRYANNIQVHPDNDYRFEKKLFNKEGARMGVFISFSIVFALFFVFIVLISVHVDKSPSPFASWKPVFIPLWIALGFIALGITFGWRLMKSAVALLCHLLITGCTTAVCIVIYLKIQGHYSVNATWYKALVPLWLLDFVLLILLLWHTFARAVFTSMPHFTSTLSKSKKEKPPSKFRDQAASLPIGVAGVFMLLFQVTIVCKTEGVFVGDYNISWSIVWLWFWLSCAFGIVWVLTYRFRPAPMKMQRLTKV